MWHPNDCPSVHLPYPLSLQPRFAPSSVSPLVPVKDKSDCMDRNEGQGHKDSKTTSSSNSTNSDWLNLLVKLPPEFSYHPSPRHSEIITSSSVALLCLFRLWALTDRRCLSLYTPVQGDLSQSPRTCWNPYVGRELLPPLQPSMAVPIAGRGRAGSTPSLPGRAGRAAQTELSRTPLCTGIQSRATQTVGMLWATRTDPPTKTT